MPGIDDLFNGEVVPVAQATQPAPGAVAPAAAPGLSALVQGATMGGGLAMPSSARVTGFDDDSISSSQVPNYEGKTGVIDRIGLLDVKLVAIARVHYHEEQGVGYVLCQSEFVNEGGVEVLKRPALCCKLLDESKRKFVTPIIKYQTSPNGALVQVNGTVGFQFMLLKGGDDKFIAIRELHREWNLMQHDLIVRCEDDNYQRLVMQPAKESILRHEAFQQQFGAQVNAFVETMRPRLLRVLGKTMDDAALMQKMGRHLSPTAAGAVAPAIDVGSMIRG